MSEHRMTMSGRIVIGVVVMGLGVLFTLDNFGLLDAGQILRAWPVLLVAWGVMKILGVSTRPNAVVGVILTGIGLFLLAHNYGFIETDPWNLWPVFLILLGVSMVAGAVTRARERATSTEPSPSLNAFALMSGSERRIASQDFRGGDVTALMGGHVIDLRSAKTAPGGAVIDLLVCMGGIDIRVPSDWEVSSEALPIMGSVEDNTKPSGGPSTGRLVLKGLIVMGGVEVKN